MNGLCVFKKLNQKFTKSMWKLVQNEENPTDSYITSVCLDHTGNVFCLGNCLGALCLIRTKTFEIIQNGSTSPNAVNFIRWSRDNRYIVTCSDDYLIRLHNSSTLDVIKEYKGSISSVYACDISKQNDRIVGGGKDGIVHVWSTSSGKQLDFISGHREVITSIHFSNDDKFILTSALDGLCRIFASEDLSLVKTCCFGTKPITYSIFSPSERYLYSCLANNQINVMDILDNNVKLVYKDHQDCKLRSNIFLQEYQNNVEIIVPSDDGQIICYNGLKEEVLWKIDVGSPSEFIMISVNENHIVCSQNNHILIYERE